jgi:hypothetical protein
VHDWLADLASRSPGGRPATPPPTVEARWELLTANGLGRAICHPGTTYQQVDEFFGDLAPHATGTANDWAASPHLLNNVPKCGHTAARWR